MTVSDSTGDRRQTTLWRRLFGLSRYDVLLAVIPALLVVSVALSALASVPFAVAMAGGALSSGLCLLDALYINPPTYTPVEP